MSEWWEVAIGSVVTVVIIFLFGLDRLPDGFGKFVAYFGVALLPTVTIQYRKVVQENLKINTSSFVLYFMLNTFLVLCFAGLALILIEELIFLFAGG